MERPGDPHLSATPEATDAPQRGRGRVRNLFLRSFGLVVAIAFVSLGTQVPELIGSRGLFPAEQLLQSAGDRLQTGPERFLTLPTIFWWGASDTALLAAAVLGAGLGLLLAAGRLAAPCLLLIWLLYLSFVSVSGSFLSFQWDNLLLETAFFSLLVAPWRWRSADAPAPRPALVFLMLWLVLRLNLESGAAKLLSGDPTWWDLTAMVRYYETAPLPTRLAWYAHQLPEAFHLATAAATLVAELGIPLLAFGPRRLRPAACLLLMGLQATIALTANYGFFNLLSALLCLWLLDDGHLAALARRFGRRPLPCPSPTPGRIRAALALLAAVVLVPLTVLPFDRWLAQLPVVGPTIGAVDESVRPLSAALAPFRTLNAYHLFASMTNVRDEIVLLGSEDGETWEAYELSFKPGDPMRPPPFVAPHQPRVDFQLWFLLLPGEGEPEPDAWYFARRLRDPGRAWFQKLLQRLMEDPSAVAALFERMPFADRPPELLRLQAWRYTFTDAETRAATGAWWKRTLLHESEPLRLGP